MVSRLMSSGGFKDVNSYNWAFVVGHVAMLCALMIKSFGLVIGGGIFLVWFLTVGALLMFSIRRNLQLYRESLEEFKKFQEAALLHQHHHTEGDPGEGTLLN